MEAENAAPQPKATTLSPPFVPKDWPGAFGAYKYSKSAVKVNVVTLVLIWLLSLAVAIILQGIFKRGGSLLADILNALAGAATIIVYLAGVRGQPIPVGKAISSAVPFWLKTIGLSLVVGLILVVSFLLLIVPFFIVFPRLLLANYFLIDKKMGVMDSVKASWDSTKGHSGKIWGIAGANLAMAMLALTIIGIPFAIYFLVMYSAASAVFYLHLMNQSPPVSSPTTPSPSN